jgi:glucosamine-phosphate N-acetyltransferase
LLHYLLPSFKIRELRAADLNSAFLAVLANLTTLDNLDKQQAVEIFAKISSNPLHKIFAAVDPATGSVIGLTTLMIEPKFIHGGRPVGHIEDVVVSKDTAGKGIGRALIKKAISHARSQHCYKCILDCDEKVVGFYERMGFHKHSIEMRIDFK